MLKAVVEVLSRVQFCSDCLFCFCADHSGGLSSAFDRTFSLGGPEQQPGLATPSGRSAAVSNGNGTALSQQQQQQQQAAAQQQQQQRGKGVDDSSNKLRKVSGRLFGEPSARLGAALRRLFWPCSSSKCYSQGQQTTVETDTCSAQY
jgi:hypothetical protein